MPDITNHPLTGFFQEVAKEYNRGRAKHGRWSALTEQEQADAVRGEYEEWDAAREANDVTGPHGELAELPQLANVAGRRWRIKKKEQATNAERNR